MKFSIKRYLSRTINHFLPKGATEKNLDFLRKSKLAITIAISYAFCGAGFGPLYYFLGSPTGAIAICVSNIFILQAPYILKKYDSPAIAGNWICFNVFWLLVVLASLNGGHGDPSLTWNVTIPIVATILARGVSGAFWTIMIVIEAAIFYLLKETGYVFTYQFSDKAIEFFGYMSLVFLSSLILIFVLLFELFSREILRKLNTIADTDDLTNLHNRRGFNTLVEQQLLLAKRQEKRLIIIYLDLDGLKKINDTYGHDAGDKAIVQFSKILRNVVRESDIVARVGGDEFVVTVIENDTKDAERIISRLVEKQNKFNAGKLNAFDLNFSWGVVYCDPKKQYSIEQLMKQADEAMYSKKHGPVK